MAATVISRPLRSSNAAAFLRRQLLRGASPAVASSSSAQTLQQPKAISHQQTRPQTRSASAPRRLHQQTIRRLSSSNMDGLVATHFPGAIANSTLVERVSSALSAKGFTSEKTLLCASLCADELARTLEADFGQLYGPAFNLGGLSGFPFAGNTGFGAMSAHIPDDGFCLLIHGPHVGVTQDGVVGKVERPGMANVDNCCGSAIAASNYLKGITHGGAPISTKLRPFSDFQQGAVQELILPFGKRLADTDGEEGRMKELPYALYDSQSEMVREIIAAGRGGVKGGGLALLGGIQINTGPGTEDYFHPLRFDYYEGDGERVEGLLESIAE
ncbi:hypothetical protein ACHAXT_000079 [Thalassiosira profunda]